MENGPVVVIHFSGTMSKPYTQTGRLRLGFFSSPICNPGENPIGGCLGGQPEKQSAASLSTGQQISCCQSSFSLSNSHLRFQYKNPRISGLFHCFNDGFLDSIGEKAKVFGKSFIG